MATLPPWFNVQSTFSQKKRHARRGHPAPAAPPTMQWRVQPTLTVLPEQSAREATRRACFIVGTNLLDAAVLSDEAVISTYREQGSVERGFRFLKDPLFLASSVFLKKPARIMALGFIMVLCLLVYRLAEHRLRTQLAAQHQTIPDQVGKPTARPTLRWVFQLFEGIDVLTVRSAAPAVQQVLGRSPLHDRILALLGPAVVATYQAGTAYQ